MAPVGVIFFLHHLGLPCSKACFSGFERACGSKEETRIAEPKHLPPCLCFPAPPFPFLIQILFPLRFNPPLRARRPQARYPFAFPRAPSSSSPGPLPRCMHASQSVRLFLLLQLPACVYRTCSIVASSFHTALSPALLSIVSCASACLLMAVAV